MNRSKYLIGLLLILVACGPISPEESFDTGPWKDFSKKGATWVIDFEEVMSQSRETQKPVLLYFTSVACVNCRKMEERIQYDSAIMRMLKEDFLFIPLAVDDRTPLPEEEWRTSRMHGRLLKTVGSRNSTLQTELTRSGSQPVFAIFTENQEVPRYVHSMPEMQEFKDFLESAFKEE